MPDSKENRLEMGGQAVLEGVLMRTRHGYSVAVRRASGAVVIRSVPFRPLSAKFRALKAPLLRGAVSLFEMLAIGVRALQFSAEEMDKDLRAQEEAEKAAKEGKSAGAAAAGASSPSPAATSAAPGAPAASASGSAPCATRDSGAPADLGPAAEPLPEDAASVWSNWAMAGMLIFSLAIAVGMMVILPNLLAEGMGWLGKWATGHTADGNPFAEDKRPLLYNLISGGFRAVILLGYIALISRLPDIRRVFQYHGAEHKAVFAFETGGPVTVDRAQTFTTFHPRCGTSFLVVVVAVSIVVFAFVAWAYATAWPGFISLPFAAKKALILVGHIVALPVVAGCSYEFLKLSARLSDKGGGWKWLVWPGLQTQRLTTREPDNSQVEVAILALQAALAIRPDESEQRVEIVEPGRGLAGRARGAIAGRGTAPEPAAG